MGEGKESGKNGTGVNILMNQEVMGGIRIRTGG